jgi:threonine dehydratase
VAVAGLIKMSENVKKKRVGVIISGGNVDLDSFFSYYYNCIHNG